MQLSTRARAFETSVQPRSPRATPLEPVRDYLQDHLDGSVSINVLVRLSGLTEFHLIRAFRRQFGLPPHAYHVRLRLARAAELLAGGMTVGHAAHECGFADQSHLSRKFKEVYGTTPGSVRSMNGALRTKHSVHVFAPPASAHRARIVS